MESICVFGCVTRDDFVLFVPVCKYMQMHHELKPRLAEAVPCNPSSEATTTELKIRRCVLCVCVIE